MKELKEAWDLYRQIIRGLWQIVVIYDAIMAIVSMYVAWKQAARHMD